MQEPNKGSDVLAKHARSDRRNGLKLSNPLTVPHIQCAKRTHDITRSPGTPVASCGSRPHFRLMMITIFSCWTTTADILSWKSCPAVISTMKALFATFGISEKMGSDNGPQFPGAEFSLFSEEGEFHHVTKSPLCPQANELVEKSVQTAKQLLNKVKTGSHLPYLRLLKCRNTQMDGLALPSQLLINRRLRATLATVRDKLRPEIFNPQMAMASVRRIQQEATQSRYYSRGAKQLQPLRVGDLVHIQTRYGPKPGSLPQS